jgi:hypothetical protein
LLISLSNSQGSEAMSQKLFWCYHQVDCHLYRIYPVHSFLVISSIYGNLGIDSYGVGPVSVGCVIDPGDIGFNDDDWRVVVGDVDAALLAVKVIVLVFAFGVVLFISIFVTNY